MRKFGLIEGADMVDESSTMSIGLRCGVVKFGHVLGENMPVVQAFCLVRSKVEAIDVRVIEVQKIQTHRGPVKVSVGKEVIEDIGAKGPSALACFLSFLRGFGFGLNFLLCHERGGVVLGWMSYRSYLLVISFHDGMMAGFILVEVDSAAICCLLLKERNTTGQARREGSILMKWNVDFFTLMLFKFQYQR